MFCARAWIFTEKNATSKIIKKSPKNQFPPGGAVFALAPPSPKPTPPKGHFWRYLRCFMHIEQSSKMTVFLPPGRGSAAAARPPIAKAKAKPHAMRSNMPGIRCLVHRRIIPILAPPGDLPWNVLLIWVNHFTLGQNKLYGILKGEFERGAPNIPHGFHDPSCFLSTRYAGTFMWFYYPLLAKIFVAPYAHPYCLISIVAWISIYIQIYHFYIFEHMDNIYIYIYIIIIWILCFLFRCFCSSFVAPGFRCDASGTAGPHPGGTTKIKRVAFWMSTESSPRAGHHGNKTLDPIFRDLAESIWTSNHGKLKGLPNFVLYITSL